MSNDDAWLSVMIFVNSSVRARIDSYNVGSSKIGIHVRVTGRLWGPSNEEKQIPVESYGALLGSNLENKLCYGV